MLTPIIVGCDDYADRIFVEKHAVLQVMEVQAVPPHVRRHCSKGCFYDNIPSQWYLDIVTPDGRDAFVADHPPWRWMNEGCYVNVTYWANPAGEVRIRTIAPIDESGACARDVPEQTP